MLTSLHLILQEVWEIAYTAILGVLIALAPIAACAAMEHLCNTLPPTTR